MAKKKRVRVRDSWQTFLVSDDGLLHLLGTYVKVKPGFKIGDKVRVTVELLERRKERA